MAGDVNDPHKRLIEADVALTVLAAKLESLTHLEAREGSRKALWHVIRCLQVLGERRGEMFLEPLIELFFALYDIDEGCSRSDMFGRPDGKFKRKQYLDDTRDALAAAAMTSLMVCSNGLEQESASIRVARHWRGTARQLRDLRNNLLSHKLGERVTKLYYEHLEYLDVHAMHDSAKT